MPAIEAQDVTKQYGSVTALEGLSLTVEAGSTFGLLGTNGAGKTTLIKLLVNHMEPDSGELRVGGVDVGNAGVEIRRTVGYLPEQAGFPSRLTGREVLQFHARVRGLPRTERVDRIGQVLETVGLTNVAERRVKGYSNGMHRRLGLATALLPKPQILLLDEPTAGLDPLGVSAFHRIVRRLKAESELTVLLSSHVLSEVESLCDAVAVLHDGQLRAAGRLSELRGVLDGMVIVEARLAPGADDEPARAAVDDLADITQVASGTVELRCTPQNAPEILDRLLELPAVEGFEVREPGLKQVFETLEADASTEVREVTP